MHAVQVRLPASLARRARHLQALHNKTERLIGVAAQRTGIGGQRRKMRRVEPSASAAIQVERGFQDLDGLRRMSALRQRPPLEERGSNQPETEALLLRESDRFVGITRHVFEFAPASCAATRSGPAHTQG